MTKGAFLAITLVLLFLVERLEASINNCAKTSGSFGSEVCDQCNSGYYPSMSRTSCLSCINGCDTCTMSSDCSKCKQGFYRNTTSTVKCDPCKVSFCIKCDTSDAKCDACAPTFEMKTENNVQTCNITSKTALILGLAIGIPLLVCCLCAIFLIYCCCCRNKNKHAICGGKFR